MTAAISRAVVGTLQADSVLAGLAPGGVQWGFAPETVPALRTVLVALQLAPRVLEQGGVAHVTARYQVKVIDPATTWTAAAAAFARIETLLDGAQLAIAGQAFMAAHCVDEFAYPERTEAGALWQHVGGDFEVWSDPS